MLWKKLARVFVSRKSLQTCIVFVCSLWPYLKIFDQAQNTNALAYLSRVTMTNDKKVLYHDKLISSNEAKETRGTNAIKHLYDAAIS